ncbi:cut-4, partial [Pristionchus pacificus]|uniref:Cut-4 n=1 Tax=Pristionchus pacificus TaxID=54126 RepID=A0A2A6B8I7_PRIPA
FLEFYSFQTYNGKTATSLAHLSIVVPIQIIPSLLSSEPHYVTQQSSPSPSYVTIDNGILGDPEVRCGSEDISLHFASAKPFMGKIFVKGHVNEAECVQQGDSRTTQSFTIRFDSCGVRRQREINGVVIIATVIVSFHSIFITKVDRAYRTSCFYMEATKVVNQQIDVGALTTASIRNQVPIPTCRYEILAGGPSGNAVSFARIGDNVYHKWSCDAEVLDVYCMRVHSCSVYDGQGGSPVTVVDVNGCSVDPAILRQLNYNADLSAGQDALVFKFADRVGLYFNCQIQLTLKEKTLGCTAAQPECPSPSYQQAQVEPSTRTSEEVEDDPRERNEEKEEEKYKEEPPRYVRPTAVINTQPLVEERPYPTKPVYVTVDSREHPAIHNYATTPVTPSGYRYPSTTPSTDEERSGERLSGEGRSAEYVELSSSRESEGGKRPAPYAIKVNPFEAATASPSSTPSYIGAHPPGFRPKGTVKQLNISSGENSTEYPSSGEYEGAYSTLTFPQEGVPEDLLGSIEAAEATVAPRRVTSHPAPEPYTRLIRRARAKSAKTVESPPSSPLFVADFDLPERSLIVLGIEDGHDSKSLADASAVFSESAPLLECNARVLPLGYSLLLGSLLLFLSASIGILAMIIYRQRKLLKNPIL